MSRWLDAASQFLAHRKGLLPLLGILFVLSDLGLWVIAPQSWVSASNLLLDLGVILATLGLLLARVL